MDMCYSSYKGSAFKVNKTEFRTCKVSVYLSSDCSGDVLNYVVGDKINTCVNHISGPIDGKSMTDMRFESVFLSCPGVAPQDNR